MNKYTKLIANKARQINFSNEDTIPCSKVLSELEFYTRIDPWKSKNREVCPRGFTLDSYRGEPCYGLEFDNKIWKWINRAGLNETSKIISFLDDNEYYSFISKLDELNTNKKYLPLDLLKLSYTPSIDDLLPHLLIYIDSLRILSKSIHYNYNGEDFYLVHKLMDRVHKDLEDHLDDIKEKYYMNMGGGETPYHITLLEDTARYLLNKDIVLESIKDIMDDIISCIESIIDLPEINSGLEDVLSSISSDILTKRALILKQL